MRAAEEFQRVTDSLSVWQAYEPAVKAGPDLLRVPISGRVDFGGSDSAG